MSLESRDEVIHCFPATGDESVALASRFGRGMIFSIYDIPLRQRSSKGCIAIRLIQGDSLLSFVLTNDPLKGLVVSTGSGREKHIRESHNSTSKLKKTKRGGRGYEVIRRGQFERYDSSPILSEPPKAVDEPEAPEIDSEETPPEATSQPNQAQPDEPQAD